MNKTPLIALAATLLVAPMTYAESPFPYCETSFRTHHYSNGNGQTLSGWEDGNTQDCDGDFTLWNPFCVVEELLREDSDGNGVVCERVDYDGHREYAVGGAWLLADDGDLLTYGAYVCWGENAHHPQYGPIHVLETADPEGTYFTVATDTVNLLGPDPVTGLDCGDGQSDGGEICYHQCTVSFPAGRDGSYQVYVHAPSIGGVIDA